VTEIDPQADALVGEWLSLQEVAERLSIPGGRVKQLLRDRKLLAVTRPNGARCVPAAFLDGTQVVKGLPGTLNVLFDCGFDDGEALHRGEPAGAGARVLSARDRLAGARLYLCTDARQDRGDLPEFLDAALGAGVDIVQLRQKGLEAGEELALLSVFRAVADKHGALLAVNDRADVAYAVGADVLHLGQGDLPVPVARKILGPEPVIGLSSHAVSETAAAAVADGVDYFCTGPVWPTPTKPGRPAPGLPLVRYAASLSTERPWFAIGGIDVSNLDQVLEAGASRVVVVRAITDAADPAAATRRLRAALE
jgi:thiamine-phosphate pyrophosphorylase